MKPMLINHVQESIIQYIFYPLRPTEAPKAANKASLPLGSQDVQGALGELGGLEDVLQSFSGFLGLFGAGLSQSSLFFNTIIMSYNQQFYLYDWSICQFVMFVMLLSTSCAQCYVVLRLMVSF